MAVGVLLVAAAGCKKEEGEAETAGGGETTKKEAAEAEAAAEAVEWVVGEHDGNRFVARLVPPEGWREWRPGDKGTITYQHPGGSSRISISTTCHGSCTDLADKLADNLAKHAASVAEGMQKRQSPPATPRFVTEPEATAPGRYFYHVEGEGEDGEVMQTELEYTRLDEGWSHAVRCTISLRKRDEGAFEALEALKEICRNLEVTVSPVEE